jgi:anaerobic dimethyl sulfoxide reductase subunit A
MEFTMKTKDELIAKTEVSRRTFLRGVSAMGASASLYGLYGCGGGGGEESLLVPTAGSYLMPPAIEETTIVAGAAPHNCGGRCVTKAYVSNGVIRRIVTDERPDKKISEGNDPQLRACLRCRSYRERLYHPGRLLYPMKQTKQRGDLTGFVRISWDEALTTITSELNRVKSTYGNEAIYNQYGSGAMGELHNCYYGAIWNLLRRYGGHLNFWGNYSAHQIGYIGTYTGQNKIGVSPDALMKSKLIVLWGSHFAETIFGTNTMWNMQQARENGARIVYIGPYQNDTCATFADQWVPIIPGTDTAMILAMIYVMIDENLLDSDFINKFVHGFYDDPANGVPAGMSLSAYIMGNDKRLVTAGLNKDISQYPNTGDLPKYPYKEFTKTPKTPEWAEAITGVKASTIVQLAKDYINSAPVYTDKVNGIQRHAEGEQPIWAMVALVAITGNWGVEGSGYGLTGKGLSLGGYTFVANPIKKTIPAMLWPDAAKNPGKSEWGDGEVNNLTKGIKFMFNLGGNALVNQHMDSNKTKGWLPDKKHIEFLLVMDNFMTPSARYADILLPGATNWEQNDLFTTWGHGNSVIYANKAVEPPGESKTIYEFLTLLSDKLGLKAAFTEGKTEEDWLKKMWAATGEPISYEELKAKGIYIFNIGKAPVVGGKAIRDNGQADAGHSFGTASNKFEFYSQSMVKEYQGRGAGQNNIDDDGAPIVYPIPMYFPSWESRGDPLAAKYPLQVLTNHNRYRSHSTHNNNPYLRELYKFDSNGNPVQDMSSYGVDPLQPLGGNGLEQVWISAADAQARGISPRDKVKVYNDRGAVYASANVTNRLVPGVAILHQGSWYEPGPDGIDAGGCANTLTSEKPSRISHGNSQMTLLVQIAKA